jgi:uncharacterized protein YwgA/O-acetyl-ADP-ribose deacetylase (regulator of RNase III)
MIEKVLVGDLFETDAQTLVNTVNCVGVMGKGVALEFKKRFPEMYEDYIRRCENKQVRLGEPYIFRSLFPPNIINFPTKDHWRSVSRLTDIIQGLQYLEKHYKEWGIESLAVPPLGCGNGGLEWKIVGPTLARYLHKLDIPVYLFAPHGTPAEYLDLKFLLQKGDPLRSEFVSVIQPGWIAIVEVLNRILSSPFHWPVGRVNLQKIAYFVTQVGIPTGLKFSRGSYGPYSPGVKKLLSTLVNQGLIHEKQLGRMFSIQTGVSFPDAQRTFSRELEAWEEGISQVVDLFLRMATTHQAELVATVHFVSKELGDWATEEQLLKEVLDWKMRRRPAISEDEVALAIRYMAILGWIQVKASRNHLVDIEDDIFV